MDYGRFISMYEIHWCVRACSNVSGNLIDWEIRLSSGATGSNAVWYGNVYIIVYIRCISHLTSHD